MNQQFKIAGRWFSKYPWVKSSTWASWKIFLTTYLIVVLVVNVGHFWGTVEPTSSQRGEKPQAAHHKPLLVSNFTFTASGLRTDAEAELYSTAFVDDYFFKTHLFTRRSTI